MRSLDFSSWQGLVTTLLGLVVVTVVMVGIRLLVMERVQQRRNRENRQINERLRTLIAAYKALGGSFTGDLAVDPTHLRELLSQRKPGAAAASTENLPASNSAAALSSDRSRRIRDSVEAALADVILLGTEEQVRLAAGAATDLRAGRPIHTDELVVSLRNFIREVLDLDPVPVTLVVPKQGPARPGGSGAARGQGRGARLGGAEDSTKKDAESTGRGEGIGLGGGVGLGLGGGLAHSASAEGVGEEDGPGGSH